MSFHDFGASLIEPTLAMKFASRVISAPQHLAPVRRDGQPPQGGSYQVKARRFV
jgi:hypothetical protein